MSTVPRVFVSAVSRELGSYRKAVTDILLKLQAFPVVQEHFPPDTRTVADMLRDKIRGCDAVIALVGRCYGFEPSERDSDRPRRSYTQLEYEIALELEKPVFTFLRTDDCPHDPHEAEPDELQELQREHLERIAGGDRIWIPFRSVAELTDGVRLLRFDADSLKRGISTEVACLLVAELSDPGGGREHQGEPDWIREVVQPFQQILRSVMARRGGRLQAESPSIFELSYQTADAAAAAALDLHLAVRAHPWSVRPPALRVGIHLGQVVHFGGLNDSRVLHFGRAMELCRRICRMSLPGQTLLTRTAFDVAREQAGQAPGAGDAEVADLRWLSHGRFELAGVDEAVEVYEVGEASAPLKAPPDAPEARRADSLEQQRMQGWRPAPGQEVPRRPGWVIDRKLGEGGFGEVWVALHGRTREPRVFKFCFDADRLGSFKRELTLFRLLRDALGDRPDIARLLEVELEEVPYYLESEFVAGGNLRDWALSDGRLAAMGLEDRLRLAAEIAAAAAAAHSVGIIHKDLKPSNVFMREDDNGLWHPMLADFGIGAVADRSELQRRNITVAGFTRSLLEPGSSRTGTRMYQPPEASLGKMASVQGDVYALGVLLFQAMIGDFDQPLGVGWERRLDSCRARGWPGQTDPSLEDRIALIRDDIAASVDGEPSTRLPSAAQLGDRLRSLPARIGERQALRRAERSAIRVRRLRRALAATAAGLVVVGGLGAFSYAEWRRAEENGRQATINAGAAREQSRLALETLRAVIFDIQSSLENLPASSPIRRRLLDTAFARLQKLSGMFVDRSVADRSTAAALLAIAGVIFRFEDAKQGENSQAARGRMTPDGGSPAATAQKLYSRALAIYESLASGDPADVDSKRNLALTCEKLGDVQLRLGVCASAMALYTRSLQVRHSFAGADPKDATVKRDLSLSYGKLGDAQLRLGDTASALVSCTRSLQLRDSIAEADPNDAEAKRDLSNACERLGDVQLQLGDTAGALASCTRSFQLQDSLAKADPKDARDQRGLSFSYIRLGQAQLRVGDTASALVSYTKALQLRESLANADPKDVVAKRDLAISYNALGQAQMHRGDNASALACFTRSFQLEDSLANADPEDAEAKRDVAISCERLGDVRRQLGDNVGALASYVRSFHLKDSLASANPKDVRAKRDLSVAYAKLGELQLQLGDTASALATFTKSFQLNNSLAESDPENVEAKRDLAYSHLKLGEVYSQQGYPGKAEQSLMEAVNRLEPLLTSDSRNDVIRRMVAYTCNDLAWLLATSWDDSVRNGSRAVAFAMKHHDLTGGKDPANLDTLAAACAEAGRFAEAVTWQKKALLLAKDHPAFVAEASPRLKLYEARKPYHEARPEPRTATTSPPSRQ